MEPTTQCKRCGKPISTYVQSIQHKEDSTEWIRSGHCSYSCFAQDSDTKKDPNNHVTSEHKPSKANQPDGKDSTELKANQDVSPKTKLEQEIDQLKKTKTWFAVIGTTDSFAIYDEQQVDTDLKQSLLEGKYKEGVEITVHHVGKDDKWESTPLKLSELVKAHFSLRIHYQPILAYSLRGIKWGAIIGVILKLLDTVILFASVDPLLAVLLVVAVGVVFIPRIGWIAVFAIAFVMGKLSGMNIFLTALASAAIGAILGILPGMSIGGIVGFIKRRDISLAPEAEPESSSKMFFQFILLPLLGAAVLIYLYVAVFNPWLVEVLG